MMGRACTCDRVEPLCDRCVEDAIAHLGGVAESRGCSWASAIARVIPLDRPWPPTTERIRAMARRKVADLATDERLRELFVDRCVEGAARWWDYVLRPGLWRVS